MPTVTAGATTLYYEVHGQGARVMLVAGLGGFGAYWRPQIPAFSKRYRVVLHDHRGTGQSEWARIPYSVEQMASDTLLYGIPIPPGAAAFEQALRDMGWIKGHNLTIDYRSAKRHLDRPTALAAELVALHADVIVANAASETKAARQATASVPIVFVVH